MKRTIFFILLITGLCLKAQQPSINVASSLSDPSKGPVAARLHINPQLREFESQTKQGTVEATKATEANETRPLPGFRLEQAERTPMFYSGVIVDLRRIGEVTELFGLLRPLDPNRDFKNILLHVQNEKPRGIVLFSLNF